MSVSYAAVTPSNLELSPMKVLWIPQGLNTPVDLGGTLGNVAVSIAYKKAELKVDQLGSTVVDRRVSGIEVKVTTELAEVQNKDIWKIVFPHSTGVPKTLVDATVTADTPSLVESTAHGLVVGQAFKFVSGTLPTGVSLNTTYYVISAGLTADAFEFSATSGGSAINTTGSDGTATIQTVAIYAIDIKSQIGDGDQANAGSLQLHPLSKADADKTTDYSFPVACASAESEIVYGPEGQAKLKIVWNILPDLSVTPAIFMRYGDPAL